MSLPDRIGRHVSEHRHGIVFDATFALAWVTVVTLLFEIALTSAPTWARYLFLAAGVPAYFGFTWSLAAARQGEASE